MSAMQASPLFSACRNLSLGAQALFNQRQCIAIVNRNRNCCTACSLLMLQRALQCANMAYVLAQEQHTTSNR